MRRHTIIGERIVAAAPALAGVARIVRSTHERIDGRGYPDGLSGSAIPLAARIVFASDAFAAMTSDRPYSRAISTADALAELRRCAGSQFDAMVVEALAHRLRARPLSLQKAPHPRALDALGHLAGDRAEHLGLRRAGERQRPEEAEQGRAAHVRAQRLRRRPGDEREAHERERRQQAALHRADDLLLAARSREVVLALVAGVLAGARERERLLAVDVRLAGFEPSV